MLPALHRVGRTVVDAQVLRAGSTVAGGELLDVLACPAPPPRHGEQGFAAVEVSLNGREFTRSGLVFEYSALPGAAEIMPAL